MRDAKVIFVAQFPPPVNGLTLITSRLAAALAEAGYDLSIVNVAGRAGSRSLRFHASRAARVLYALALLAIRACRRGSPVCYLTAEGGLGLAYTFAFALWARFFRYRLFIHHHSFNYINRRRILMGLLLAVAGPEAVHICLSQGMMKALAKRYGRHLDALVLSNATFVPPRPAVSLAPRGEGLTIGLLSNLTSEKGLYQFIEIIRLAKERGLPIRGVLAGPIANPADRVFVESRGEELAGRLDYRGPVYGAQKARFFEDVDLFVFATTYQNEAQPTVLFEAMAYGVPVMSFDRGCIRDQVGDAGLALDDDAAFVLEAARALIRYLENPALLAAHRRAALARYEDERRAGQVQIARLFETPPIANAV